MQICVRAEDAINTCVADVGFKVYNSVDDFEVLAIVGAGGGGKTTLASQICRHDKVERWFSHLAFVFISQQWSENDLLHGRSEEVMTSSKSPTSEGELVRKLHDFMKYKPCLVVLDDIWYEEAWDVICLIFPCTEDCRVMLTTGIENVSLHVDNKYTVYESQLLTMYQKWSLFSKIGRVNLDKNVEFENLVIKACGDNILKGKGDPGYNDVENMLELSYLDLPTRLKPCFLHLAIIPKDEESCCKHFTPMWIVEGFITNGLRRRQEILLTELAQHCILQVTSRDLRGQIRESCVHNLMRNYCIRRKASVYLFFNLVSITCPNREESSQARLISISFSEYWPPLNHHLRTLVSFSGWSDLFQGLTRNLESIYNSFELLRVLSI